MKLLKIFLVVLVVVGCRDKDSPDSVGISYLKDMMNIMEQNSFMRKSIDWSSLRNGALELVPNAQTVEDVYPAIQYLLRGLMDQHDYYLGITGNLFAIPQNCDAFAPKEGPVGTIGYVMLPEFGYTGSAADRYASEIQTVIKNQDNANITGWVVDLRGNNGTNMWAMLAGIGPILGEGVAGGFLDADLNAETWEYKNGKAISAGTNVMGSVASPYSLVNPNPKVAVLIDKQTSTAGEAMAVSFVGRPNTKLFGTPTCGVSTGFRPYTLSDGATLMLTVSVMADRNLGVKGGPIIPDVTKGNVPDVFPSAITWLGQ